MDKKWGIEKFWLSGEKRGKRGGNGQNIGNKNRKIEAVGRKEE